jgi:hypothetical protein
MGQVVFEGEPVVVELKTSRGLRYQMGTTLENAFPSVSGGGPISMADVENYRNVPLVEVRSLYGDQEFERVYGVVTDPTGQDVCFMGRAPKDRTY